MIERVELHNFVEREIVDIKNFWVNAFKKHERTNYLWNVKRSEKLLALSLKWEIRNLMCFPSFLKSFDLKGFPHCSHYYFKRLSSEKNELFRFAKASENLPRDESFMNSMKGWMDLKMFSKQQNNGSFKLFHVRTTVDERNNKRYLMKNLTFRCRQTISKAECLNAFFQVL